MQSACFIVCTYQHTSINSVPTENFLLHIIYKTSRNFLKIFHSPPLSHIMPRASSTFMCSLGCTQFCLPQTVMFSSCCADSPQYGLFWWAAHPLKSQLVLLIFSLTPSNHLENNQQEARDSHLDEGENIPARNTLYTPPCFSNQQPSMVKKKKKKLFFFL